MFLLVRFFVLLPSTGALYRALVLPLPIPRSRTSVSGPTVPRNRPTLPMGSRKALVMIVISIVVIIVSVIVLVITDQVREKLEQIKRI